jgi:hypothetical protein
MAALPMDVAVLLEQSIHTKTHGPMDGTYITCQVSDNLQFNIDMNILHKYITSPKYTGNEIITYRGIKIATWFNTNTGCFEGEIMFMNHQLDILAKQEHSLFKNVYYKYFRQKNDCPCFVNGKLITGKSTKGKTFKMRCNKVKLGIINRQVL